MTSYWHTQGGSTRCAELESLRCVMASWFVMVSRWLAVSLVVLSCLSLALPMPCTASTPVDYDEYDYQKLKLFLGLANDSGRNGDRIGVGPGYDPDDPSTWSGVVWTEEAPKRVASITWLDKGLSGPLDLSGCSELTQLYCGGNRLTSLDVNGCTALARVECHSNRLSGLDMNGLTSLYALICYNNRLTSLDIGGCTALKYLECYGNQLAPEDLPSSLPVPGGRFLY